MTLRDEAWNALLEQTVMTSKFKLTDLPFKESEKHTLRRCVRQAEEFGWLERTSEHSAIWRAGPKAKMLMNLSDEKLRLAEE
jgi:hypothetical protein